MFYRPSIHSADHRLGRAFLALAGMDRSRFPFGRLASFGFAACVALVMAQSAVAQFDAMQTESAAKVTASLNDATLAEVEQQYSSAAKELRSALKTISGSSVRFFNGSLEQSEEHREQWQTGFEAGKANIVALRSAALELFHRQDRPSDEVIDLALRSSLLDLRDERYGVALNILKRANSISPTPRSEGVMAQAQLLNNEFAAAKAYFKTNPAVAEQLSDAAQQVLDNIDELITQFDRELELREQETKANDLPRVELLTTAGKIVLELYENEAPSTVANFINLVEAGYYGGVIFHRVKEEFVAQAGGFGVVRRGQQSQLLPRGVQYLIYDEHKSPKARHHFRGSLSMANQNSPNTGSSQFFLCLTPQPFLNERHTVFGRVIEGLPAMADLTLTHKEGAKGKEEPIEGAMPSLILSAKVLRKQDHVYQTAKVGQPKPSPNPQTDAQPSTKTPAATTPSNDTASDNDPAVAAPIEKR